jgi:amino acid transporter
VIGNMVGSGIFLVPSSLAATAGPVSILAAHIEARHHGREPRI